MQFVRQQRLDAVLRELMAAEYNRIRVADVAMKYGFYSPGQFSIAYTSVGNRLRALASSRYRINLASSARQPFS